MFVIDIPKTVAVFTTKSYIPTCKPPSNIFKCLIIKIIFTFSERSLTPWDSRVLFEKFNKSIRYLETLKSEKPIIFVSVHSQTQLPSWTCNQPCSEFESHKSLLESRQRTQDCFEQDFQSNQDWDWLVNYLLDFAKYTCVSVTKFLYKAVSATLPSTSSRM